MTRTHWMGLGLSLLATGPTWAVQMDDKHFGLDIKITLQSEDDRDLGTRSGGDVQGIGLDLRPWVFGQRGQWSAFAIGQIVTATDIIQTDTLTDEDIQADGQSQDDGRREPEKNYLALREFWVDYAGLTDYPGEHLRLGRQRLRSPDGLWRDTNIEALNWTFDTTLLRASLGVAERFSDYRTDLDELAPEDQDRSHLFGDIAAQWAPGHWVALRGHHRRDDGKLSDLTGEVELGDKRSTGDLTWLGLTASSDAFNFRNTHTLNYWASLTGLTGEREQLRNVEDGRSVQRSDVSAWGTDLGLRWRLDPHWQIGAAYARGSGGGDDQGEGNKGDGQFEQTGLQSNRSTYTGTRSSTHRFGEAFRGELSNLQAASLFGSWQLNDDYDASLVYHRFWRLDDRQPIGDSGINAQLDDNGANRALLNGEKDLGQEVDLVLTKYFKQGLLPASISQTLDEPSALVRFRGGVFKPGDAYDSETDSLMHRAFIDVIWRY
ncbi:MAG: alginate export family protein [Pseudomonadota bacterium]